MVDVDSLIEQTTEEQRDELMKLLGVEDCNDLAGALEAFVADEFGVTADDIMADMTAEPEQPRRFSIKARTESPAEAMSMADWAAAKHRRALARAEEIEETAKRQIEQVTRWKERAVKPYQQAMSFFAYVLEEYFGDFHEGETSVDLPCGAKLRMKKNRAAISWDEDAALAFVRENGIMEAVKESLLKTPLKATLDKRTDGSFAYRDTGEIVDFVREVPPDEERTFEVAQS